MADGTETLSFYNLTQGNSMLKDLEATGLFRVDEIADARTDLASCGLPAESESTDGELVIMASDVIIALPAEGRESFVAKEVRRGIVSQKSAARMSELLKDEKATLGAADVEGLVEDLRAHSNQDA